MAHPRRPSAREGGRSSFLRSSPLLGAYPYGSGRATTGAVGLWPERLDTKRGATGQ